jgi:hypothetical protein
LLSPNSFYVILDGSVSVYIDSSKSGEEEENKLQNIKMDVQKAEIPFVLPPVAAPPGAAHSGDRPKSGKSASNKTASSGMTEEEEEVLLQRSKPLDRSKYGKFVIKFGKESLFSGEQVPYKM